MPRAQETPEILELREEIARLDHSLVMMVAARQEAVGRLFTIKEQLGRPLFDPKQETLVVARARRWARDVGAAPDEVEAVFERLIQVARGKAAPGHHTVRESGVVTVMLAVPPSLPKVRIERSVPAAFALGLPSRGSHDDDPLTGPGDDHHLGPKDRRPKPTTHPDLPA